VAEFQAAVKQYAPGLPIEASGIDGWEPGKAFEHIARRIAPNEVPTSKAILDSANSLNGDDITGSFSRLLPRRATAQAGRLRGGPS